MTPETTNSPSSLSRRAFLARAAGGAAAAMVAPSLLRMGSAAASTVQAAGSSVSGTLTFMSWDTPAVMQPVIAAFNKLYPSVNVEISFTPPVSEYISTLQERLLAGTAADIFIYTAENKAQLNQGNFVRNLSDQPWVKDMAAANLQFMSTPGGVWGLSPASWAGGVIYNTKILAKAGYKQLPGTWSGFLELCSKLKAMKITPYYDAGTPGVALEALIGTYYKTTYGKNIDPEIFARKISFVDAWEVPLTQYSELYSEGLVSQAVIGLTGTEMDSELATGKLAMLGSGPWDVASVQKDNPNISLFMGAVPGPAAGQQYWCGAPNEGWAVNAKAHDPAAALVFLSFLASGTGLKAYMTSSGDISTMSDYTSPVGSALTAAATAARQSLYYYHGVSWPSEYETPLTTVLIAELQSMFQGKATVKQVLQALDAKLKQLLA
jgi:raffinose/stachyose/melibiose transport system substrate-binding protein